MQEDLPTRLTSTAFNHPDIDGIIVAMLTVVESSTRTSCNSSITEYIALPKEFSNANKLISSATFKTACAFAFTEYIHIY